MNFESLQPACRGFQLLETDTESGFVPADPSLDRYADFPLPRLLSSSGSDELTISPQTLIHCDNG